ncbi:MAG TPA: cupredoxin domain-containing protein [Actinomycetota bacterium]
MEKRKWVAVLVFGAVVFAACGSGDGGAADDGGDGSAAASSSPSASSASPSDGGRYGYDYGSGGNGGGNGGGSGNSTDAGTADVTAEATNFEFTPSTIQVTRGDVLAIDNTEATTPHTFTVADENIDLMLDADSSTTLTIDLPAGSYPFECRFHGSSGMSGTLVVG